MSALIQGTQEWLEVRKTHIGASDAPIIMGDSPWKTCYQLWEEKLDLCEQPRMNSAMQRGHDLEPIARQVYNDHTGNCAEPEVLFHPEHKWMMASLDGISLDRSIIVEIKCPGIHDHATAAKGGIPEKYYAQLQHQLVVANLNLLHYFSYREGEFYLVEVERDEKYIHKMQSTEEVFWENLSDFKPPELSDRDYIDKDDDLWLRTAQNWSDSHNKLVEIKGEEKSYRESLIQLANNKNCRGAGVKIQKVVRKGSVDYKSIPSLSGVDLEGYRNSPVETWRLKSI